MRSYLKKLILIILMFSHSFSIVFANDYSNHWAKDTIIKWLDDGLIAKTDDELFYPDRAITRAEFVAMVTRRLNLTYLVLDYKSPFKDVDESDWFFSAVMSANRKGLISGVSTNEFAPFDIISRQDAVTLLGRAYQINSKKAFNISAYPDGIKISDYALSYMAYAIDENILKGYANRSIAPYGNLTRAEAIVLIERMDTAQKKNISTPIPAEEPLRFIKGYPKLNDSGLYQGFNLKLQTNLPCTIYYELVDISEGGLLPTQDKISSYLIGITDTTQEVSVYIPAQSSKTYHIVLKAVHQDGRQSRVFTIPNAKTLFYPNGNGTIQNPYLVSTEEQLNAIRFFPEKHFKLKNDIALSKSWIPIGAETSQSQWFRGSFDGDGHQITNLSISAEHDYVGLFAYVYGGTVKNLSISASSVQGKNYVGILAGKLDGGKVMNCTTQGTVQATSSYAGGIVGENNGEISKAQSSVLAVKSQTHAGGITGNNTGKIQESMTCVYLVSSGAYASGISGTNYGGEISDCVAINTNIINTIANYTGRITNNRSGTLKNNYGYNKMNAVLPDDWLSSDNGNGDDVSWEQLCNQDFYQSKLGWDFSQSWYMPTKTDVYRLPSLKQLPKPQLEQGLTIYAPKQISTAEELQNIINAPDEHYILINDIIFPDNNYQDTNWISISAESNLLDKPENGFSGSLDGQGHTIHNLKIDYQEGKDLYGMFGIVASGTIRNLNLSGATMSSSENSGILTAINYGTISNCKINGAIFADQLQTPINTGGVVGINYGTIEHTEAYVDIIANGNNTTTGGICANNEGNIVDCSSRGSISVNGKGLSPTSTTGGITGLNSDGKIYNVYSDNNISIKSKVAYTGGVSGIINNGEIYKASTNGYITIRNNNYLSSTAYVGGIVGLHSSGKATHTFTFTDIDSIANTLYIGGMVGYNLSGLIQSGYASNKLLYNYSAVAYVGGILGYNENGFLYETIAINKQVSLGGTIGRVVGVSNGGILSNNYAIKSLKTTDLLFPDSETNGISFSLSDLKNNDFYFKPISQGGRLGWASTQYDDAQGVWVWGLTINPFFTLPLLNQVKGQHTFTMPRQYAF